jgi:hypothetical protein
MALHRPKESTLQITWLGSPTPPPAFITRPCERIFVPLSSGFIANVFLAQSFALLVTAKLGYYDSLAHKLQFVSANVKSVDRS